MSRIATEGLSRMAFKQQARSMLKPPSAASLTLRRRRRPSTARASTVRMRRGEDTRMKPLFDNTSELVGWIDPHRHLFDTDMSWRAYISHGHAWSAETGDWLGPVKGLVCFEQSSRVIAWNPDDRVAGIARPATPQRVSRASRPSTPSRPSLPSRPSRPSTPSGGWSPLSFWGWLDQ
jgi:hypothetical protein